MQFYDRNYLCENNVSKYWYLWQWNQISRKWKTWPTIPRFSMINLQIFCGSATNMYELCLIIHTITECMRFEKLLESWRTWKRLEHWSELLEFCRKTAFIIEHKNSKKSKEWRLYISENSKPDWLTGILVPTLSRFFCCVNWGLLEFSVSYYTFICVFRSRRLTVP